MSIPELKSEDLGADLLYRRVATAGEASTDDLSDELFAFLKGQLSC